MTGAADLPGTGRDGINPARARLLALIVPAALLAGAWGSQLIGGLYPCEMCHWQRWPHYAAVVFALLAFALKPARWPVVVAALLVMVSGAIGVFHAGVEYGWWEGVTQCSSMGGGGSTADILRQIMATPLVRCDVAQWSIAGISLAGFNAIFSLGFGGLMLWLLRR